ncbi:50S ribosomal protein L32 [candidate division WWE3 bacterium]|nr:50S ribosomal protein L32 [candidate division WWE3 bacterium]
MPKPKKKHSKRRTATQRNARYSRDVIFTVKCKKCGSDKLSHAVCPECGSEK